MSNNINTSIELLSKDVSYIRRDIDEIRKSLGTLANTNEGIRDTLNTLGSKVLMLEGRVQVVEKEADLEHAEIRADIARLAHATDERATRQDDEIRANREFRIKLVGIASGVGAVTGGVIASIVNIFL